MDRRESIKSLFIGSIAGGGLLLESCAPNSEAIIEKKIWDYKYGRTPKEAAFDEKLLQEKFFDESEMTLIVVLANLILPPTKEGTIEQAGVPKFIEFMMKDIPEFQTKIRGGLMWLNTHSSQNFKRLFINISENEQKYILDKIAFPNPDLDVQLHEVQFFSLLRNIVMTGYFTSEVGVSEIGYQGNVPNIWDGVPEDVLKSVGVAYDQDWIDKCIDQDKRNEQAEWDDQGNLLT
jgi:hypothetical protein